MQSTVREGLSDRRLSKSVIDVELGGFDAAMSFYDKNATPHLVILESSSQEETLISEIETLAEVCDAGTSLLLIGDANDITLYRELLRRGVSEYLTAPLAPRQILDTVTAIFIDPDAPPMGKTMAFYGSRGGCGSSTMAHNVAWQLADEMDEDVILIDLDIQFGTAALAFNLEASQGVHTAMADPDRLDDVLLDRFLLPYGKNLSILGTPATLDFEDSIRSEALDRLLDLTRSKASYVVMDIPRIWAPWSRQMLIESDQTIITSLMDLASLRDCKNLFDRLLSQRSEASPTHLILNHAGAFKRSELTPKDFSDAVDQEANLILPHEPVLFGEASNNGQMLSEMNRKHKIVDNIREFVQTLTGRQSPKKGKSKGLLGWGKSKG